MIIRRTIRWRAHFVGDSYEERENDSDENAEGEGVAGGGGGGERG